VIGYGSVTRPYQEHPAEPIQEVHWIAAQAVKWKQGQIIYIERAVAAIADTAKGACAFWVKGLVAAVDRIRLVDSGVGGRIDFSLGPPTDPEAYDYPLSHLWSSNYFGGPDAPASIQRDAAGDNLQEVAQWYHVYIEWDTASAGGYGQRMMINGVEIAVATYAYDDGPPFVHGWKTGAGTSAESAAPADYHSHLVFCWNAVGWLVGPTVYSIAEFWLGLDTYGVGVDKFVNLGTGTPKSLGASGELPTGTPPKFYFSRRGEPISFVTNRGSAGTTALTVSIGGGLGLGDRPAVAPEDGPQAEPDAPHYTPATAMAA
jgi:hypothetical protein